LWKGISKPITNLLKNEYEHLDARGSELKLDMFTVGKRPSKAAPTIIFSCENKACRQKAMALVDKRSIIAEGSGVLMAQSSRLPRLLALEDDSYLKLPKGVYANGPMKPCGLSVLVVREDLAPPRKATIGGFVCIDNEHYGFTTAHAFLEATAINIEEDTELDFSFYGSSEFDDSSDDDDLWTTSKGGLF
jgi:hypothetical protein